MTCRHPQTVELFEEATGDIAVGEIDAAIPSIGSLFNLIRSISTPGMRLAWP